MSREVADAHGIETRDTAYFVLSFVREGVVSAEEARTVVDFEAER